METDDFDSMPKLLLIFSQKFHLVPRRLYHIVTGDDFHHFYKNLLSGSKY